MKVPQGQGQPDVNVGWFLLILLLHLCTLIGIPIFESVVLLTLNLYKRLFQSNALYFLDNFLFKRCNESMPLPNFLLSANSF